MTPEQWHEIDRIYNDLAESPPSVWRRAVQNIQDEQVRQEVQSLLEVDRPTAGEMSESLARMIGNVAGDVPAPSMRFGSWRVTGVIGYGGMGAVYEAVRDDHAFDKKVAIKVLQTGRDNPSARDRFQQERAILATLNHPNIAHLIDGGETPEGVSYIVMEFVDGLTVTDWCDAKKAGTEEILRLFLRICSAVEYAHQRLVVHRDLKPGNILVTAEGVPKLLDFGIAKLIDENATLTKSGWHAMTPAYASPEQVTGKPITTATDVYSLGIVLYEMLTGRTPYQLPSTSSPALVAQSICDVQPEAPKIAADLDNILLMALRKEPERRYQSAAAFAADIENYLAHKVVNAREDTLWYRASRYLRRNRLPVAAAVAVLLALAGGIVASQMQARRAQQRFDAVRGLANEVHASTDALLRSPRPTTPAWNWCAWCCAVWKVSLPIQAATPASNRNSPPPTIRLDSCKVRCKTPATPERVCARRSSSANAPARAARPIGAPCKCFPWPTINSACAPTTSATTTRRGRACSMRSNEARIPNSTGTAPGPSRARASGLAAWNSTAAM